MALTKSSVPINFSQGLNTKTDPFQVAPGQFLSLENSVFDKGGQLTKRNGYAALTPLPDTNALYATTFNGNLTAIGSDLQAYSASTATWVNKGALKPLQLNTLPLIRSSTNQSQADTAIAANGLVCTVFTDNVPVANVVTPIYKYVIANSVTGQNIVPPTVIIPTSGTVVGSPRVFLLGRYFIIVFTNLISATNHLSYIAINSVQPTLVTATASISALYTPSTTLNFDGVSANNSLYLAWNGSDGSIKLTSIDFTLTQHNTVSFAGHQATIMSVTADETGVTPVIYASFYNSGSSTGYALAVNQVLSTVLAPTEIIFSGSIANITASAQNALLTFYYEVNNNYGYDASIPTHYLNVNTITQAGVVGSPKVFLRSVGLASKSFLVNGVIYLLGIYNSIFQPTYFLLDQNAQVVCKFAYQNGPAAYYTLGLPNVTVSGLTARVSYLYKDLISAVNKAMNAPSAAGVYSQTGINLINFTFESVGLSAGEIGGDLHLSGGFLWMYDGYTPVEHNFFLYPDNVEVTGNNTGGGLASQQYFYVALYEWADNQGNVFRSAPSIPVLADLSAVMPTPVSFTSAFQSGVSSITVSSTTNLSVGQVLVDSYPPTAAAFNSVFSSGAMSIIANTTSGLVVGQQLMDNTTPGNLAAGTTITSIVGSTIGLSLATTGNSTSTPGDAIQVVTQTNPIQAGTTITSIVGSVIGLSLPTTGTSIGAPGDTITTTTSASTTIDVPTLRLTYKLANPAKITIYRWSVAQQTFYQVTSIIDPILNDPAVDYITYTDTASDDQIIGNNILYTTGGVIEDISAPASSIITLFQSRLFLVDAEDPNLLWFSKQVIEATPVEMSDLLTVYVPPTTGAQGSTGPITALAALDDKLIIFKNNAAYYINGTGPDNTGSNNNFSEATFITATVGCSNQQSIVFQPNGLMFQSDKGIWLLGRDLSTNYIGAPVEQFTTGAKVESAVNVPGTNQVRFTMDSGVTLMYDYYYSQWGTFAGVPAISSTLYQGMHTYINSFGQVYQESPGSYQDGSEPVLMSFTTSWLNLAGLQGFERAYYFYLLGTYISPHRLQLGIAYDYASGPTQMAYIQPDNYNTPWGGLTVWGAGEDWGGNLAAEQWRVFLDQQKCQAFQIQMQEIYDSSLGVPPGAGLTISGLNVIVGAKKSYPTLRASRSTS